MHTSNYPSPPQALSHSNRSHYETKEKKQELAPAPPSNQSAKPRYTDLPTLQARPQKSLLARICCCCYVRRKSRNEFSPALDKQEKNNLKVEIKIETNAGMNAGMNAGTKVVETRNDVEIQSKSEQKDFESSIVKKDFFTADAQSLALAEQHLKHLKNAHLDLSHLRSQGINRVTPALWRAISDVIKSRNLNILHITFPARMREIPDGFRQIKGLQRISLPAFAGESLDIRETLISGPMRLDLLQASCITNVIANSGTAFFIEANHKRKITLQSQQKTGEIATRTLNNHIYIHYDKFNQSNKRNDLKVEQSSLSLNTAAKFSVFSAPGISPIKCRHLSLQWLIDRAQRHIAPIQSPSSLSHSTQPLSQPLTESSFQTSSQTPSQTSSQPSTKPFTYENYHTKESIAKHTLPSTDHFFYPITSVLTDNHLVEVSCFGQFLAQRLAAMATGENQYFFMVSLEHAMALEIRKKLDPYSAPYSAPHSAPYYVINFYDPNMTASHLRLVLLQPEDAAHLTLENWLPREVIRHYFKQSIKNSIFKITALNPTELGQKIQSVSQLRTLRNWRQETSPEVTANEVAILVNGDHHQALSSRLQSITGRAEVAKMLSLIKMEDYSPLQRASCFRFSATVAVLTRAILSADIPQHLKIKALSINFRWHFKNFSADTKNIQAVYCEALANATQAQFSQDSRRELQAFIRHGSLNFKIPNASDQPLD
jgi:hypothetical protein